MSTETHARPNFVYIFLALFVLTMIEVFCVNFPWGKKYIILALIFLAVMKAALVAMFYMHLRYEKILLTVIALAPLIFSVVLVFMIGYDLGLPW